MNYSDLINIVTDVGYLLMENGAEIYRVEESMQRLFRAYGVQGSDVYAIPNCITVTICALDGKPLTKIKRIPPHGTNIDKLEKINDLCRRVCRDTPEFYKIRKELYAIDRGKPYGFWIQVAAFAFIGFAFCLFFGGNFADACCAIVCGACLKLTVYNMERFGANSFFKTIVASAVVAAIAMMAVQFNLGVHEDKIIIGTLMNLVPGIAITSFMRDIMAGDLMAGLQRFTESFLIATAIALGAGIAMTVPRLIWGV